MGDSARNGLQRVPAAVKGGALLALGWVALFLFRVGVEALPTDDYGNLALFRLLLNDPDHLLLANSAVLTTLLVAFWSSAFTLAAATLLLPLGFVARTIARARVRAGLADPLDRVRLWPSAHPGWARALTIVPAVTWTAFVTSMFRATHSWSLLEKVSLYALAEVPTILSAIAIYGVGRALFRALLAPTLNAAEAARTDVTEGEISFDAVAVTRETRAAVGAMAALSVAMVVFAFLPNPGVSPVPIVLAYAAVALGGAALFRRASRVAIGADGVYVTGTSRTRFFAYRDLDAARVAGSDIELVRRDRVVLRLQLHGADATKREAVLDRIRVAIDRVKGGDGAAAQALVEAASSAGLARAALGAGDFRQPAVSREALWQLVEGPTTDLASRTAAAQALASSLDPGERPRLRVAASQCAEPGARVALEQLAELEAGDDAAARVAHAQRAR